MKQSRTMSLVEAVTNVVVGYAIAVVVQLVVFPLFGLVVSLAGNLLIGGIFTAVSIARAFALRRLFEAIRVRGGVGRAIGLSCSAGRNEREAPAEWRRRRSRPADERPQCVRRCRPRAR